MVEQEKVIYHNRIRKTYKERRTERLQNNVVPKRTGLRAYQKSIGKMFRSNILRLLAMSLIIAIGIGIVTGIGALPEKIRDSIAIGINPAQAAMAGITADKIELLSFIFPVFFIAVAALVTLTTMTRLIEEERPAIACLKTLGYSSFLIVIKYILFALVCAALGCLIGILAGNFVISNLIFNAVKIQFDLPSPPGNNYVSSGLLWSAIMAAATLLMAFLISLKRSLGKPADLLRPKAPKAGKSILLEKIPFFWKRLKFKYKSSIRNIVRFKGRLIMTVLSVAGSTIILFCGLGLFSSLNGLKAEPNYNMAGFIDSILPISIVIILCGVSLAVLVLFNLTNINVEERKREIATLKVLGYNKWEVAGYIYREVFLLSALGIIIGVPSGYFLLGFIFDYIEFGSLDYIEWYVWAASVAIALLSVFITDILLYRKIDKIEMVSSLKIVE